MNEKVATHIEKRGLQVKKFWEQNKEVVIRFLVVVVAVFALCMIVRGRTISRMKKEFAVQLAQETARVEAETTAQMVELYGTKEDTEMRSVISAEAKTLAKMLYPMQYNSEAGLKSACWCAINRVESKYYPNTIDEVCSQSSQWMGWSENNPVLQRLYDIAYEQLALWHNGVHAVSLDFVFLQWSEKEITLRSSFDGKGHFWYESDWS